MLCVELYVTTCRRNFLYGSYQRTEEYGGRRKVPSLAHTRKIPHHANWHDISFSNTSRSYIKLSVLKEEPQSGKRILTTHHHHNNHSHISIGKQAVGDFRYFATFEVPRNFGRSAFEAMRDVIVFHTRRIGTRNSVRDSLHAGQRNKSVQLPASEADAIVTSKSHLPVPAHYSSETKRTVNGARSI